MQYLCLLLILALAACNKQAGSGTVPADGAKFETLLATGQIDRVETVIPFTRTNILTDAAAKEYLLSLRETNRIAAVDTTKAQVTAEVVLMSGTNELAWLSQFDNGLWKFGDYSFRLRTSP